MIDISHYNANAQFESVQQTIKEIGAGEIPTINVFNKADLLDQSYEETKQLLSESDPNAFLISAQKGWGLSELCEGIENLLFNRTNSEKRTGDSDELFTNEQ